MAKRTSSPVPQPAQDPMSFLQALEAVIHQDAKITKLEWNDDGAYCMMRGGFLMIHRDDEWFRWTLNDGDLLGEDWVIYTAHVTQSSQ